MAFDGIITRAQAQEIAKVIEGGRIDKIYEPEPDSIVLNIKTALPDRSRRQQTVRLFASCHSAGASVRLISSSPENPKEPYPFCMLLRKHIQGSKIVSVKQRGAERIIELTLERLNELGLMVTKKLIFEIMGKYSNMILVDMSRKTGKRGKTPVSGPWTPDIEADDLPSMFEAPDELRLLSDRDAGPADDSRTSGLRTGNMIPGPEDKYESAAGHMILGSIKGVPSGLSRVREVLPGRLYEYPPAQDKIPFDTACAEDLNGDDPKEILKNIGGISPSVAEELALLPGGAERKELIDETLFDIDRGLITPRVYEDESGVPREFHIIKLTGYGSLNEIRFDTLSDCMHYYFEHRAQTSRITQRSNELIRPVQQAIDKLELKKQRLLEDLLRAEDSDKLRLYGELLTANMSMLVQGATEVTVTSYYDGSEVTIALDPRWPPSRNAQSYYKRYAKSRTALKEKKRQLEDTESSLEYLESSLAFIENAGSIAELEALKAELEETGYIKRRRSSGKRPPKFKAQPREYVTTDGFTVLVGRNNRENDVLTLEIASRGDYWLHTKDIPGSHVILRPGGREITETAIFEAAALAALYSKAKNSGNVPVDYVPVRYVKKPSGARPGKVIFTHNRTVYVDPAEPDAK